MFYKFVRGAVRIFYRIVFRAKVEGIENIPKGENFIFCPNHKSLHDAPLLSCVPLDMRFMAKEELFRNPFSRLFFRSMGAFPVKRGKSDIGALKAALKVLSDGEILGMFPEGVRSFNDYMEKGKPGAALIAIKSQVKILPVGICGKYRLFEKMIVRIGKPIDLSEYYGTKPDGETLQQIIDEKVMPAISYLSEVPTYENRNCR